MNIEIIKTKEADIPAIIGLLREFAVYSNLLEYLEVTADDLREVIFGPQSFVRSLTAFADETPVGYAFFYPAFSSFRGQTSVYLEDIFITKARREHGLGEKMLREIARCGRRFGAVRMDFQVLRQNTPAIGFYQKLGAVMDADERHFKFVDENFRRLAE